MNFLSVIVITMMLVARAYIKAGDPIKSFYVAAIVFIIFFFILLFTGILFGKKYLVQPSDLLTEKEKNFINKHKLKFEIALRGILFLVIIVGIQLIIIPCIKDLPALLKEDYTIVNGVIVEQFDENGDRKNIKIKDNKTGEIINLQVNYEELITGQEYTIRYLPNIERGEIIENTISP